MDNQIPAQLPHGNTHYTYHIEEHSIFSIGCKNVWQKMIDFWYRTHSLWLSNIQTHIHTATSRRMAHIRIEKHDWRLVWRVTCISHLFIDIFAPIRARLLFSILFYSNRFDLILVPFQIVLYGRRKDQFLLHFAQCRICTTHTIRAGTYGCLNINEQQIQKGRRRRTKTNYRKHTQKEFSRLQIVSNWREFTHE